MDEDMTPEAWATMQKLSSSVRSFSLLNFSDVCYIKIYHVNAENNAVKWIYVINLLKWTLWTMCVYLR